VNQKNKRQYYIHPKKNNGRYSEPNHVDVGRPEDYDGPFDKKRFAYLEEDD
jgi:hypothetical protein